MHYFYDIVLSTLIHEHYYDHFLKLFYTGATASRWTITPSDFANICSFWLFPQNIFNGMKQVPPANITSPNYNLRAHVQEIHFDEEENFSKFLELSTKTKSQVKRKPYKSKILYI